MKIPIFPGKYHQYWWIFMGYVSFREGILPEVLPSFEIRKFVPPFLERRPYPTYGWKRNIIGPQLPEKSRRCWIPRGYVSSHPKKSSWTSPDTSISLGPSSHIKGFSTNVCWAGRINCWIHMTGILFTYSFAIKIYHPCREMYNCSMNPIDRIGIGWA